jgi:hypothetical protein
MWTLPGIYMPPISTPCGGVDLGPLTATGLYILRVSLMTALSNPIVTRSLPTNSSARDFPYAGAIASRSCPRRRESRARKKKAKPSAHAIVSLKAINEAAKAYGNLQVHLRRGNQNCLRICIEYVLISKSLGIVRLKILDKGSHDIL